MKSSQNLQLTDLPVTPAISSNNIVDMQGSISQNMTSETPNSDDMEVGISPISIENGDQNKKEEENNVATPNNENEESITTTENEKVMESINTLWTLTMCVFSL